MQQQNLFELPPRVVGNTLDEWRGNQYKNQGDQAELLFDLRAIENGFAVSRPITEALAYDRVLDNGTALLRVQIKSVKLKRKVKGATGVVSWQYHVKGSYSKNKDEKHKPFSAADFDVLAVRFIGHNDSDLLFFLAEYFHGRKQCWMNPRGNVMKNLVGWESLRDYAPRGSYP